MKWSYSNKTRNTKQNYFITSYGLNKRVMLHCIEATVMYHFPEQYDCAIEFLLQRHTASKLYDAESHMPKPMSRWNNYIYMYYNHLYPFAAITVRYLPSFIPTCCCYDRSCASCLYPLDFCLYCAGKHSSC